MRRPGFTLVEIVIAIAVSGILFALAVPLAAHGVRTMVFLPRAMAVNQAAADVMHQLIEGGFSDSALTGQTIIRGLRSAVRRDASATGGAVWLVEASRVGYRTSDGLYVVIWRDGGSSTIRRGVIGGASCGPPPSNPASFDTIPYDAAGNGITIAPSGTLFVYYGTTGAVIAPIGTGCPSAPIRQVEISLTAQTGNGLFDQGQAQQTMSSSATIRVP